MKRLIRKASTDMNLFFRNWLEYWDSFDKSLIQTVIDENPDCLYSGDAYRIFGLDESRLNACAKQLNLTGDRPLTTTEATDLITGCIHVDNSYQSFSKTMDGIDEYAFKNSIEGFEVIIETALTGALDIELLFEKYRDELTREVISTYRYYSGEEEVVGLLTGGFTIQDVDNLNLAVDETGTLYQA